MFMQPEVTYGRWYEIETLDGYYALPFELIGDAYIVSDRWVDAEDEPNLVDRINQYVGVPRDRVLAVQTIDGWGARLSASGYLDCTDWCVFQTEQEARDYASWLSEKDEVFA